MTQPYMLNNLKNISIKFIVHDKKKLKERN